MSKIIYAVNMLHYAPLFIAYDNHLKQRNIEIELAPEPYGDQAAYSQLMSISDTNKDVDFCVCDPMVINLKDYNSENKKPIILAQILKNVPFWAVDHNENCFNDLKDFSSFNQIFSYKEPNTGYYLAKYIHSLCSKTNAINPVKLRDDKGIDEELDFYLTSKSSVVIEADILKIKKYINSTENKIVFNFPNHKKFKNFCFTVLLTRKDVLKTEEGKLETIEILKGLLNASNMLYHWEDNWKFIKDSLITRFGSEDYKEDLIKSSIAHLVADEVISRSMIVSHDSWYKRAFIQRKVDKSFKTPSFNKHIKNIYARKAYLKTFFIPEGGGIIIRNPFRLSVIKKIFLFAVSFFILLYPVIFLGDKITAPSIEPYLIKHFLITITFIILYSFRSKISDLFRLDKSSWFQTIVGPIIIYIVAEYFIIKNIV